MNEPREFVLSTGNGELAALHWPKPGAPRLMCLHGWLDNANSFVPLAQLIKGMDIVALDFAGHGYSAHRPPGARYYFTDYLWDLEFALDEIGWDRCHIVGHSLGGVVACAYAAAAVERVQTLVLLDGIGAPVASANQTAERLHHSLSSTRNRTSKLREFENPDAAVKARLGVSDFSIEAARLICQRSLAQQGEHYRWRTDPRLKWTSPFLMSEEQLRDILANIQCPTLSLTADNLGQWLDPVVATDRHASIQDCQTAMIEGHHHFHMDNPQAVARRILDFLRAEGVSK